MKHLFLVLCLAGLTLSIMAQQRGDKAAKAGVPAAATAANGLRNEEVKFTGHGVSLAGTFTWPSVTTPKKQPAMLLLGAMGATPRDGMVVAPNVVQPIYKALAEHFASQGFVTFRYDKRCAGASACPPTISLDDYLDDAQAALNLLRARPEVNPAKVFLLGHNEGGQFAASLAASDDKLAGIMLAAVPSRTLNKVLREQTVNRMHEAKEPKEKITAFTTKFDIFARAMASGDPTQMKLPLDPKDPNEAMMLELMKQIGYTAPMFINDPLQTIQAIKIPVLILQGEKDLHVSVKDANFMSEALLRLNHKDTTYKLFPEVNHLLKDQKAPATTNLSANVAQPLSADVLSAISEWLNKRN